MKHAEATLGSGNLRLAVVLPDGEDQNEWVAVNSESGKSVSQSVDGLINIYIIPFIYQSVSPWTDKFMCQLIHKSISQPINQPTI